LIIFQEKNNKIVYKVKYKKEGSKKTLVNLTFKEMLKEVAKLNKE